MTPLTSVLIVDDEPAVCDLMSRWASSLGLEAIIAGTAEQALVALQNHRCDLAIIDIMMPGRDGIWLANEVQRDHPAMPVILSTGYSELLNQENEPPLLVDLLVKPFQRERFALAVTRSREWRTKATDRMQWHARLSRELRDHTEQICAYLAEQDAEGLTEADVLIDLAEERRPDTTGHCERVAAYAAQVAHRLGVRGGDLALVERAARFHDIGKIALPDALFTKRTPLTADELAVIRRHAEVGAEILASTRTLSALAPIVRASHEWFNGNGYPLRVAGTRIPLASRIIAVVDAYDAMAHDSRTYRDQISSEEAIVELRRSVPTQFDPQVFQAFLAVLEQQQTSAA
jgi:putative two-component system response regulator